VQDVAIVLDAVAGYDANDPVTAEAVGHIPQTYTQALDANGLRGARIGIIREPLDPRADTNSEEFKAGRAVMERAIGDMRRLGAEIVDMTPIPDLAARSAKLYDDNQFETEAAVNAYLAQHKNAPVKTLSEILLSGKVVPWRQRSLMNAVGRSTSDPGYLQLLLAREQLRQTVLARMADQRLDALAYATFDYPPPKIPADALTRTTFDSTGPGNNRRLSPVLGLPAITVPAGFTGNDLPIGLELMGRAFTEPLLLKLAYAYEQGTKHRRPPATTPAVAADLIRR
jgi:amidase